MTKLRITWEKSAIGYNRRQRMTLKALGFRSLHQTVNHNDSRVVRGMLYKVRHLVKVEEISED